MSLTTVTDQSSLTSFVNASSGIFWRGDQLCSSAVGRRARLMKLLWEEGLMDELRKLELLPELEPVADAGSDYEFGLGLRQSYRVSYCYEWCAEMWKAGALHLLQLLKELAGFQLTIDALQPHYLIFDGPRPVYINAVSFTHLTTDSFSRAIESLSAFFLHPVVLSSSGKSHLARKLLRGVTDGIKSSDFVEVEEFAEVIAASVKTLSPVECLRKLESEIERMPIVNTDSEWSNYYGGDASLAPEKTWSSKQQQVYRVLNEHAPRSVLDLACNVGWFSRFAATTGADVVAADFDETCVNRLYKRVQSMNERVLPVLMDINDPSPGFGVDNSWLRPASERFQSDLVLALAVSHHLVFSGWKLTFDELARAFSPFVRRRLLIEWIPFDSEGMIYSTYDRPECAGWYDLDSFMAAFAKHFSRVSVLPADARSRRLVLCER